MKIINKLLVGIILISIGACSDSEAPDKGKSVINLEKESAHEDFDKYLKAKFIDPYNIEFVYKWRDIEADMNYALVPANYKNSIKMSNLIKYFCLDTYEAVAPKGFLKKYFPKKIMVIGSPAYKNNGTMILGEAEGGLKITLYNINELNTSKIENLFKFYFRIIYHEFSHILHQTIDYTTDFDKISEQDYKSGSWSNAWEEGESLKHGFISDYASKEPNEDFVELIAHYVTNNQEAWDEILEKAGEDGKKIMQQKTNIMKSYLKEIWQIDPDKLRTEIMNRTNNIDSLDLDNITF